MSAPLPPGDWLRVSFPLGTTVGQVIEAIALRTGVTIPGDRVLMNRHGSGAMLSLRVEDVAELLRWALQPPECPCNGGFLEVRPCLTEEQRRLRKSFTVSDTPHADACWQDVARGVKPLRREESRG